MDLTRVLFFNAGYCMQWSRLAGRPTSRWDRFYAVFVYLEHPRHGPALIDTGYSPAFFEATRRFPQRFYRWLTPVTLHPHATAPAILKNHGIDPDTIRLIFVSHFHADHIAGLSGFPAARFVYRGDALDALERQRVGKQVRHGFLADLLPTDFRTRGEGLGAERFQRAVDHGLATFDFWGDGSLVLVDLPGHADGHTGFVLRFDGRAVFYIVDACWDTDVLRQERPLPALSRRFQASYPDYVASQSKIRRLAQETAIPFLSCHCPQTQHYVANP